VTDYSKLQQMQKDFLPYSNLWLTTNRWFTDSVKWLQGEWQQVNALEAEKFVEEGTRTLGQVQRFFKDRDITAVTKIASVVKVQMDEFKPKVPLMVALRKEGMQPRHWKNISETMGFTVEPDETFTFQKALDMGLLS